jgi:hypothetical protein
LGSEDKRLGQGKRRLSKYADGGRARRAEATASTTLSYTEGQEIDAQGVGEKMRLDGKGCVGLWSHWWSREHSDCTNWVQLQKLKVEDWVGRTEM